MTRKFVKIIVLCLMILFVGGNSEVLENFSENSTQIQALLDYETGRVFYKDDSVPACFMESFLTAFELASFVIPLEGVDGPLPIPLPALGPAHHLRMPQSAVLFCEGMQIIDLDLEYNRLEKDEQNIDVSMERGKRQKRQTYGYYRNNNNVGEASVRSNYWNSPNYNAQPNQAQVQGQVFGSGMFSGQAQSQHGGMSQSQVQLSGVGIRGQIASSSGNAQAQLSLGNGAGSGQASGLGDGPSSSQVQVNLGQRADEESMASASATSGGAVAGIDGRGGSSGGISTGSGGVGHLHSSGTNGFGGGHGQNGYIPGHPPHLTNQQHGHMQNNGHYTQQGNLNGFGGGRNQMGTNRFPGIQNNIQGPNAYNGAGGYQHSNGAGPIQSYPATSNGFRQNINTGSGTGSFQPGAGGTGGVVPGTSGLHYGNGQNVRNIAPTTTQHGGGVSNGHTYTTGTPISNGIGSGGHSGGGATYPSTTSGSVSNGGFRESRTVTAPRANGGYGGGSNGARTGGISPEYYSPNYQNGYAGGSRTSTTVGRQPYVQSHTPGAYATSHGLGQAQAQTVYFGNGGAGSSGFRYYQDSQPGSASGSGTSNGNGATRYQDQQVGIGTASQRQQTGGAPSTSYHQPSTTISRGDEHSSIVRNGVGATSTTNGQQRGGSVSPIQTTTHHHQIPGSNGSGRQTPVQNSYQPQTTTNGGSPSTVYPTGQQQQGIGQSHQNIYSGGHGYPSYSQQNGQRPVTSTSSNGVRQNGYTTSSTNQQIHTGTVKNGQPYRINGLGQIIPAGHGRHTSSPLPTTTTITEAAGSGIGIGHEASSSSSSSGQSGFFPAYGVSRATADDPEAKKCTIITFSCTIVIESNGRAKICRPNAVRVNGGNNNNGATGAPSTSGSQICCC